MEAYGEEGCDVEAEESVGAVEEGADAGGEGRAGWWVCGVSLWLMWGWGGVGGRDLWRTWPFER